MGLIHSFFDHLKKRKNSRYFFLGAVTFFYILFLANTSSLLARNFLKTPKNEIKNPIAFNGDVKGESTEATSTPTITPTPLPTAIPTPTRKPSPTPGKNLYRIAIFGDSMVDTMGETLEYLEQSLKKKYPGVNFALYNYGQGSINVEEGLEKFNQTFSYSSRLFAPLPQIQADIIILGSFAYNPTTPYSRDRHWLGLTKLIDEAEKTSAKIYLLAEIAPLRREFGKGPNGVNWDSATVYTRSV